MIYKQYLGIYINESNVQYTNYYKFFPGLLSGGKGLFKLASPKVFNDLSSRLNFKKLLDSIKPSKRRRIYICLPRKYFFTRRLQFPELPLDDVRDSVVSNLETYSHLPVDEIYYDVLFSKVKGNEINALLFYAPRKKLDIFINQLIESGHYKSLECIFPFSYGAGPWHLDFKIKSRDNLKVTQKKALVIQYEDSMELAIYSGISCIDSVLLDAFSETEKQDKMIQDILADHDMSEEQIAYKNTHTITENDFLNENMGGVALAPFYSGMQHISVDENLPRIKLFKPMKLLFPLFMILGALMAYMSVNISNEIEVRQKSLAGVKQEIMAVEKEITPILEAKTALKRAAEYKGDVEDFVLSKPPLFSYINDLAQNVPENTWFAHLSYKPGIISMQGEGDDVLKVVESLRISDKYKEVKLNGAVSRTKEGKDKFVIDLILKDLENKSKQGDNESVFVK